MRFCFLLLKENSRCAPFPHANRSFFWLLCYSSLQLFIFHWHDMTLVFIIRHPLARPTVPQPRKFSSCLSVPSIPLYPFVPQSAIRVGLGLNDVLVAEVVWRLEKGGSSCPRFVFLHHHFIHRLLIHIPFDRAPRRLMSIREMTMMTVTSLMRLFGRLHSGLKRYEIDAFLSWKKTSFP